MYKTSREFYKEEKPIQPTLNMQWTVKKYTSTKDPSVWGQPCWFTLHNFAVHYPEKASPICAQRCREFIRALPYMIPCEGCSEHAMKFVNDHEAELPVISAGKIALFKFFVDFHNYVNERYGKKTMTDIEAYNLYNNGVTITTLNYS